MIEIDPTPTHKTMDPKPHSEMNKLRTKLAKALVRVARLEELLRRQKKAKPEDKHDVDKDHNKPERPKKKAEHHKRTTEVSGEDAEVHKQELGKQEKEKESEGSRKKIQEENSKNNQQLDKNRRQTLQADTKTLEEAESPKAHVEIETSREYTDQEEGKQPGTSWRGPHKVPLSFVWIAALIICLKAGPSNMVIEAIFQVIGSISSAASTTISAGASGISQILDSIVGASSILLYILVLGSWFLVFASKYCNSIKLHLRSGTQGKEQPPEPSPEPSRENGVPHNISRDKISRDMETRHSYQRPHLKWPQSQTLGQLMMDLIPTYNKIW